MPSPPLAPTALGWISPVLLLTLLGSCGSSDDSPKGPGQEQARDPATLTYAPVLDSRLLEVCPPRAEVDSVTPAEREQVLGLLQTLGGNDARFQKMAREELTALGGGAGAVLDSLLLDDPQAVSTEIQTQAVKALGLLGSQDISTLVEVATSGRLAVSPYEHSVRREALYQLGLLKDDRALLRLIRHLKYEKDPENFLWLGWALLELQNGSGLPALYDLTRSPDADLAARTHAVLKEAAAQRNTTAENLLPAWIAGDLGIWPTPEVSEALRCLVWREIEAVSGKHFQMRGVDDARNQLRGLGTWVAEPLAEVLRDKDGYVRLHACQILQRLGPRGRTAVAELQTLLPDVTAGATAAAALGSIGTPSAYAALNEASSPQSSRPLRIAALEALALAAAPTGGAPAREAFGPAVQAADTEMATAAACALLRTQADEAVFDFLTAQLSRPDSAFVARTFDHYVAGRIEEDQQALQMSFQEIRTPPPGIPSMQQTIAWHEAYAAWLQQYKAKLLAHVQTQDSKQ